MCVMKSNKFLLYILLIYIYVALTCMNEKLYGTKLYFKFYVYSILNFIEEKKLSVIVV